jgi:uncharacterized protein (TIGR02611 family)
MTTPSSPDHQRTDITDVADDAVSNDHALHLPSLRQTHVEIETIVADVADDPISRPRAIARLIWRVGRKLVVTMAGVAVVGAGVAMLVLPGPGFLVIIVGLAILATEFVWADRLLRRARAKAAQGAQAAKGALKRSRKPDPEPVAPPTAE